MGSRILLGIAATMLAVIMVLRLPWIASEVPLAYNEGWNAYHAAAVRDGTTLYPSLAETGTVNNYPPISFLAIGTIARAGGDPIRIGRIINLIGLLVTVMAMVGLVRRLGGARTREATLFTIAVTLFPFLALWHSYLGINDPQMLAHGIMLGAALLIVRAEGASGATAGGAALMAVAGFTKHNLLPLPIAMLAWLLLSGQRRAAWAFLVGGLGAAAALVAGAYAVWGSAFFESLLFTPRVTRWDRIPAMVEIVLWGLAPMLLVAGWLVAAKKVHPLASWYFGVSGLMCLLALGGEGVWYSGAFDWGIATALVATTMRSTPSIPSGSRRNGTVPTVRLLVLGFLAFSSTQVARQELWGARNSTLREAERAHEVTMSMLRVLGDSVACDHAAHCFLAGIPWRWDAFNVGQAIELNHRAGLAFLARVEAGHFSALTLERWNLLGGERIPERLAILLRQNYRPVDSTSSPIIMVPK